MLRFARAFAAAAAAMFLVALVTGACDAASSKKKAKVSVRPAPVAPASQMTKVYVPANILKGSLVTKGRAFYKCSIPENTLAGITLSRPANQILAKWGNPSRITVGTAQAEVANVPTAPTGPSYIPPGGGFPNPITPFMPDADLGRLRSSYAPLPPGPEPMEGPGATPQGPAGGGETRTLRQEEVTWTYDLQNGITLEFIITDGTITQITVGGEGPWGLSKTRTGLQLGDSYKLVLWVMGFPEEPQKYVGRFLRVSYIDKNRALFTFLNKKLVGITIALVQQELREGVGEKQ